ncbi:hypothetical protein JIG36_12975 [Actinoplanes sp. LDG1-06]|uniref:Excalibur calcium-binding domain-containing protein n=1 Tax=Paractinoplanes ovalisporus TaxID=2810368 RepID=A0ABS2A9F7_9ACTN|nr:hypothetical protein [Actinoplanes ovalisporus]MBM2616470.1 hypothetical protein [Actinoplanes ovalisporus]
MTARRVLPVVVAVLAAVVALFLALRPGPDRAAADSAAPVSAAPAPPARPAPSTSTSAAASPAPEGVAAAATAVTLSARPASSAAPAPFVQTFAAQPGVKPLPALASPTAPVSVPANVDGCDHGYGTRTQCVPWAFPPSVTDKCAWLTAQGFKSLTVHGTDRHKLDPDKNGIACDS